MKKEQTITKKIKDFLKNSSTDSPIIVIAGPTASGKSSLAIDLANKFNGYIINGDSRQIYQELKIGTAQPTPESSQLLDDLPGSVWKIQDIPHLLYGHVSIFDKYTLFDYQNEVNEILSGYDNSRTPFLVGGTGLYIDSVAFNYDLQKEEINKQKRAKLKEKSVEELQKLAGDAVKKLNRSDKLNPHRLIRLIERGGNLYQKAKPKEHLYIVINPAKGVLEKNISMRVDKMVEDGLVEENKELREMLKQKGVFNYKDYPKAMKSIGYSEFNGYFSGNKGLREVKEDIVLHSLQYAKRQGTWFKRHKEEAISI